MPRWLVALGLGIVGIATGLIYGWNIDPVKFVDTPPSSLRADYRADYVLMVAESYHSTQDVGLAQHQLAILGSDSPAVIVARALQTAQQIGYAPDDQGLMQDLMVAMQAAPPASAATDAAP